MLPLYMHSVVHLPDLSRHQTQLPLVNRLRHLCKHQIEAPFPQKPRSEREIDAGRIRNKGLNGKS